ncbi:hypothetical protein LTS15_001456 [Exophiala xenobiotica]|nr:hypothetical protein LTS15_001456 [Exophiala xenobiotica]
MEKTVAEEKDQHVKSGDQVHLEKAGLGDHAGLDDSNLPRYDDKETKRILRKVDYRLLPMLTLLYVLAFLDRGNIGNAKVAGMNKELNLTGTQYNIALTVFFFPYAIFEVPSNIHFGYPGGGTPGYPRWWDEEQKEGLRDEEHETHAAVFVDHHPHAFLGRRTSTEKPSKPMAFPPLTFPTQVMTLQGIVQNYHGLIITRTLLGLTESGFFPAATYLLTT